jgi:hypothetical protein
MKLTESRHSPSPKLVDGKKNGNHAAPSNKIILNMASLGKWKQEHLSAINKNK